MEITEVVHQLRLQLWNITYEKYLTQDLFSYQWWGLIMMLVVIYFIWWMLVEKRKLVEILLFGSFVTVIMTLFDLWGISTARWQYNIGLLPFQLAPFPFDYSVGPVFLMLAYQYGKNWITYTLFSIISSGIVSFVMAPIFQTLGIKSLFNWHFSYFFFIIIAIAIIARSAIILVLQTVRKNSEQKTYEESFSPLAQPATKRLPNQNNDEAE